MQWLIDIIKEWVQLSLKDIIVLWSGAIVDIPDGWHLCDGTKGTPDLRDKFVPGAGSSYAPGDTGGSTTHTHSFIGDGHSHGPLEKILVAAKGPGNAWYGEEWSTAESAEGVTDPASTLPTYYALAYIMKL